MSSNTLAVPAAPPEALDARTPVGFRTQPHNIEAEQALLGAILVNNEAYHRVARVPAARAFLRAGARPHLRGDDAADRAPAGSPTTSPSRSRSTRTRPCASSTARSISPASRAPPRPSSTPRTTAACCTTWRCKRGLIHVGEELVNKAYDPTVPESGREQIELAEQQLFMLAQEGEVEGGFRAFPAVLTSTITMVEAAYHKDSRVTGVPTGLIDLDDKLGGLQPSDLVILAGRPSMGKTALAVTHRRQCRGDPGGRPRWPRAWRASNYAVGVFSLEMSAEQLAMRLLSAQRRAQLRRPAPRQAQGERLRARGPGEPGAGEPRRSTSTTRRRSRSRRCAPGRAGSSAATACRCWWSTICSWCGP